MGRVRHGQQSSAEVTDVLRAGFTIIETMVVIAVTGVLFVAIVGTISSRQSKVQFNQAINQVKGQLEGVINEVASGRFPDQKIYGCNAPTGGPSGNLQIDEGSPRDQGTNKDCIFIGKILQFGTGYGDSPEKYAVYPVAGYRGATRLDNSYAMPLEKLKELITLTNGLSAKWVKYGPGAPHAGTTIGALGIFVHLSGEDMDGDGAAEAVGSQSVEVRPIMFTYMNEDNSINNVKLQARYAPHTPNGVHICFKSGSTNQSGLITLGGSKAGTSAVALEIKQNTDCI